MQVLKTDLELILMDFIFPIFLLPRTLNLLKAKIYLSDII